MQKDTLQENPKSNEILTDFTNSTYNRTALVKNLEGIRWRSELNWNPLKDNKLLKLGKTG
jgi:hypothetical protein